MVDTQSNPTVATAKKARKTRTDISERSLLHQAKRVSDLLEKCGDTERQNTILKIVSDSLESTM